MTTPDEPTAPITPAGPPPIPAQPGPPPPPGWQPSPHVPTYVQGRRPGEPPAYPPPPYTPYAPPRPMPPRKDNTAKVLWWTFGSIAAATVLICGGLAAIGAISERNARANLSVTPTRCDAGAGVAYVEYEVKNNGGSTQTAKVLIEYRDATGARLDTDTGYVRDIPAGDTAKGQESTILDGEPTGDITCRVRIG